MNKTFNNKRQIIYLIIAIIGLVLITLGTITIVKQNKYYKHGDKVEGIVEYILDYPQSNSESFEQDMDRYNALLKEYFEKGYIKDKTKVAIIISYIHNGDSYTYELGYFSAKYKIGDPVTIYVSKNDPLDFLVEGRNQFGIITSMVLGGILLLVGLILIFVVRHNNKFNFSLLKEGNQIEAEVLYVDVNEKKESFGRHPVIFTCVYKDPDTDEESYFTSDSIYSKNFGNSYIGKKVKVYIDKDNKKNYYVDVEKFEKE